MVYFFTSRAPENWLIYMGEDKFVNEDLIAFGWPEDIWFHVDDLSSAHVYLRMPAGKTVDDIPEGILEDCLQLVKQNSIEGCKLNNVPIVYTPWKNLKKTKSMEVGQVGFHDEKAVKKAKVAKKDNTVINRLNKTKTQSKPDLRQMQEDRLREIRREEAANKANAREQERKQAEEKRKEKELMEYRDFMDPDKMVTNTSGVNLEDDFW